MNFATCIVPLAHMRLLPDHRQELTSQVLFGESAVIVEARKDGWLLLQNKWDNYMGWCRANQFSITDNEPSPVQRILGNREALLRIHDTDMSIPMGSVIDDHVLKNIGASILSEIEVTELTGEAFSTEKVRSIAGRFLNTNYLWGGRSIYGIDCSAFVQSVYRFMNVKLMRDAKMQVTQGEPIGFLQEAECGDLAFFEEDSEIMHVGILLNEREIIHAAGKVRIDHIDPAGIINSTTGERTHRLRIIKRIIWDQPSLP